MLKEVIHQPCGLFSAGDHVRDGDRRFVRRSINNISGIRDMDRLVKIETLGDVFNVHNFVLCGFARDHGVKPILRLEKGRPVYYCQSWVFEDNRPELERVIAKLNERRSPLTQSTNRQLLICAAKYAERFEATRFEEKVEPGKRRIEKVLRVSQMKDERGEARIFEIRIYLNDTVRVLEWRNKRWELYEVNEGMFNKINFIADTTEKLKLRSYG